jgi:hypothetical protein
MTVGGTTTDASTLAAIRTALAALEHGISSVSDFEAALAGELSLGRAERAAAAGALRAVALFSPHAGAGLLIRVHAHGEGGAARAQAENLVP